MCQSPCAHDGPPHPAVRLQTLPACYTPHSPILRFVALERTPLRHNISVRLPDWTCRRKSSSNTGLSAMPGYCFEGEISAFGTQPTQSSLPKGAPHRCARQSPRSGHFAPGFCRYLFCVSRFDKKAAARTNGAAAFAFNNAEQTAETTRV